jgi:hypothetical protein
LEASKRNPFLFDYDLLFDESNLGDWTTPGEEAEVVEEVPEEAEKGELGRIVVGQFVDFGVFGVARACGLIGFGNFFGFSGGTV